MLYNDLVEQQMVAQITAAIGARQYKQALDLMIHRNDLIWQDRRYSHDDRVDFAKWQRIEQIVTKDYIDQKDGLSDEGEGLIFIVGMPRCGKTTLERVLGGIDGVTAAGELNYLSSQYGKVHDPAGNPWTYPDYLTVLPDEVFPQFGKNYSDAVKGLYKDSRYIIDTMPPTFRYLGLIRLILPKAKVIHMVRSPMDHCIDIFSKKFDNNFYNYTYHLETLSEMYVAYRRLMAHWDDALGDWMMTLRFEDLIAQPKKEIKRVMGFCEIESDITAQNLILPHQTTFSEINRTFGVLKNYRPYLQDFEKSLGRYKIL